MRTIIIGALVSALLFAGCGGKSASAGAPVNEPSFVPTPEAPPSPVIGTPFAVWFLKENEKIIRLKDVVDLASEEDLYNSFPINEDFFLNYTLFFRDFDKRVLLRAPEWRPTEAVVARYADARGLPKNKRVLSPTHVREIINDADLMERYWQGQYFGMTPAADIYPLPSEFPQASTDDPGLYTATAMAQLVKIIATARVPLPEDHRQAVSIFTIDRIAFDGAVGMYRSKGFSPRISQGFVEGIVVFSRDVIGLADDDDLGSYVFTHETGHAVDDRVLQGPIPGDLSETFYDVSWKLVRDTTFGFLFYKRRRSDGLDFLTTYGRTNWYEDMAEHYGHYVVRPKLFREKILGEWERMSAVTVEERSGTPLFHKYWLLSILFHGEEYGDTDEAVSSVLATMPKEWPAPPAPVEESFFPLREQGAALASQEKGGYASVRCSGFPLR